MQLADSRRSLDQTGVETANNQHCRKLEQPASPDLTRESRQDRAVSFQCRVLHKMSCVRHVKRTCRQNKSKQGNKKAGWRDKSRAAKGRNDPSRLDMGKNIAERIQ